MVLLTSCAGRILNDQQMRDMMVNNEYDDLIQIEPRPDSDESGASGEKPQEESTSKADKKPKPKPKPKLKEKPTTSKSKQATTGEVKQLMPSPSIQSSRREPDYEDTEGFDSSRRPLKDPFRVGESVSLDVSYFNMVAGTLTLSVKDFVQVNQAKAYEFEIKAESNRFFSRFYSVQDVATTYVNFETLLPYDLRVKVNESNQVKDIRSVFDWQTGIAKYWETKVTKKGEEKKQKEWELKPWSQNVISGIFYLRIFQMEPGKTLKFHLTDEGKDIMVSIHVLRREPLKTKSGMIDTLVLNPQVEVDGVFKPMGDVFLWVTDDDRKMIVGVETKIKIGTIKAKLAELNP